VGLGISRLLARDPLTLTFVLVFPIVTMLIIGGSFGTEPEEAFPLNPSHWYQDDATWRPERLEPGG